MSKIKNEDFKDAKALGQVFTQSEEPQKGVEKPKGEDLGIDSPEDFRLAIGHAQMEGLEYVEVSQRVFDFIARKSSGDRTYITYGDPGIKVFVKGTREEMLNDEEMNAEIYYEKLSKKRALEAANKPKGR